MCSFLALRTPYPLTWPMDLSQFGTIISEVPERLEIHLTDKELERIDELKQAWVSKYAEEGMVCHVRFGHFEPDLSRTLVFQQGYKIPRDPRKANVTTSSTVPVMSGQARRFQSQSSELVRYLYGNASIPYVANVQSGMDRAAAGGGDRGAGSGRRAGRGTHRRAGTSRMGLVSPRQMMLPPTRSSRHYTPSPRNTSKVGWYSLECAWLSRPSRAARAAVFL